MSLTNVCYLIIIIAASVTLSHSSRNYSVSMTLPAETVTEGDTVTAVCDVTDAANARFFVVWVKKTVEDNELEIATNTHINSDFHSTGRYNGSYVLDDPKNYHEVKFYLQISDLKSEDSGMLTCAVGGTDPVDFKPLIVHVPVQKIWWTTLDDDAILSDHQTVLIKEGDVQRISCHINGSYPQATVQVFLGDEEITHLFNVTNSLKKGDGPNGLKPLFYRTDVDNRDTIIGYRNMTKPLRCVATTPNSRKETSINVKLTEYSPTFLCDDKMQAKLHEQYFNLTCKVHANPGVKDVKFHWISDNDDDNDTLRVGDKSNGISANMTVVEDSDEVIMVMTIYRVSTKHFMLKYVFEAENDVKRVAHVIKLVQDVSPAFKPLSGACSLHVLKVTLPLILLMTTVFSLM